MATTKDLLSIWKCQVKGCGHKTVQDVGAWKGDTSPGICDRCGNESEWLCVRGREASREFTRCTDWEGAAAR
jgi:hypothetical protein